MTGSPGKLNCYLRQPMRVVDGPQPAVAPGRNPPPSFFADQTSRAVSPGDRRLSGWAGLPERFLPSQVGRKSGLVHLSRKSPGLWSEVESAADPGVSSTLGRRLGSRLRRIQYK